MPKSVTQGAQHCSFLERLANLRGESSGMITPPDIVLAERGTHGNCRKLLERRTEKELSDTFQQLHGVAVCEMYIADDHVDRFAFQSHDRAGATVCSNHWMSMRGQEPLAGPGEPVIILDEQNPQRRAVGPLRPFKYFKPSGAVWASLAKPRLQLR